MRLPGPKPGALAKLSYTPCAADGNEGREDRQVGSDRICGIGHFVAESRIGTDVAESEMWVVAQHVSVAVKQCVSNYSLELGRRSAAPGVWLKSRAGPCS